MRSDNKYESEKAFMYTYTSGRMTDRSESVMMRTEIQERKAEGQWCNSIHFDVPVVAHMEEHYAENKSCQGF